jgi:hypothetical protein
VSEVPVRRLSRRGATARLVAVTGGLGILLYGTVWGTDDMFPFGPLVQYAFSVDPNGEIRSTVIDADTDEGELVRVPLSLEGVGIKRAEIEGQLTKIVDNPALLQAVADAQRERNPQQPQYERLYLRQKVTTLVDGAVGPSRVETLATWDVVR